MKWARPAVGVLSFAAVLALVLHESKRPAPGPLHPSHALVAELDSCESCHSDDGDWARMCGDCHEDVTAQIADQRGLHGRLNDGKLCAKCHVEHHGATVALVGSASFAAAGIPAREDFDHGSHAGAATGLHGRHDELECAACHAHADAESLAPGQQRFLGLGPACATCHDDAHEGTFGTRCEGCHGQEEPFAGASGFDHGRFPLVDAHADVTCATCHADGSPIGGEERLRDVRACAACHDDPHGEAPLVLRHSDDCARCHGTATFAGVAFDPAAHAAAGVPLRGRHADATCAGCHALPSASDDLQRCDTCHDDVHSGAAPSETRLASQPLWSTSVACTECHDEHGFRPARVGGAEHGRFGQALEGAHVVAECVACHSSASAPSAADECGACHDSPHRTEFVADDRCAHCHAAIDAEFAAAADTLTPARHTDFPLQLPHDQECVACHPSEAEFGDRFPGRDFDACEGCHGDAHSGDFASGSFADAACLTCHAKERFAPSSFTPALHERTAFPLDGAHAAVACAACHPGQGARRRFDRALTACAECHDDLHRGAFDRPGLPNEVSGRKGCARCHSTDGFRASVGESFDHEFWTGQRLTGAHARAGCGRCHDRSVDGALGDAPSACSACHSDPHRGQFRRAGGTNCGRCHEQRESFTELRFEHDRDTRFRLDSDHARLPCAACHRPISLTGGQIVTLYRPLGTSCRDCHAPGADVNREVPR